MDIIASIVYMTYKLVNSYKIAICFV